MVVMLQDVEDVLFGVHELGQKLLQRQPDRVRINVERTVHLRRVRVAGR